MTCPKCGALLPDDAVFCAQCGAATQAAQTQPPVGYGGQETPPQQPVIPPQYSYNTPPQTSGPQINGTTYLVFSILATVLCCLPLGIPAIIFATKIDKAQAMGDYMGAQDAAKKSKMWSIIAAASCAVVLVLYFVLIVFLGAMNY